jgi:hypothetical protein
MFLGALENNDFVPKYIEFSDDNWTFSINFEALQWEEHQALKYKQSSYFLPVEGWDFTLQICDVKELCDANTENSCEEKCKKIYQRV